MATKKKDPLKVALLEINYNPSDREVRWTAGLWFPIGFAILGLIIGSAAGVWTGVFWMWGIVGALCVMGLVAPRLFRPLFVGWMVISYPIGWAISHVVLGLTYFAVLTPIGLAMQALGRDPMERQLDRNATSYWKRHEMPAERSRYFRQF